LVFNKLASGDVPKLRHRFIKLFKKMKIIKFEQDLERLKAETLKEEKEHSRKLYKKIRQIK